ncbi:MAG TPA: hypothetical protein VHS74_09825 [Solirubrobacterales bacterium]|jgi:hypothetical protein|nr:hypothetical protein [Solirubrobacterales bacterium]
MTEPADSPAISLPEVDLAAERLLNVIDAACESAVDFPDQLDAALGAILALFAAEPELIRALTDRSVPELVLDRQRRCRKSCVARLRAAADRAADIEARPLAVEPFLVASVQFQVSRALRDGETHLLPESRRDLRDFLLVYYREPLN